MTRDQAIRQLMASAAKLSVLEIVIAEMAGFPHPAIDATVQASRDEADLAAVAVEVLRVTPV